MLASRDFVEAVAAVGLSGSLSALAIAVRRRAKTERTRHLTDGAVVVGALSPLFAKLFLLVMLLPGPGFSALPLHVCDVAALLCAGAVASRRAELATAGVFTALFYSSLAICWPDLGIGPTVAEVALFWWRHVSLVVAALYLLFGLRLYPSWHGYLAWIGAVAIYVAIVVPVNALLGTNFGYLTHIEDAPAVLAWLGPWPQRSMLMVALPALLGAVVTLIFGTVFPLNSRKVLQVGAGTLER